MESHSFLKRKREGIDLGEREREREIGGLGGVEGKETLIGVYWIRKEYIFNFKKRTKIIFF